jgi:hypothetical protein
VHLALLQQKLDSTTIADLLLDRRPAEGRIGEDCRARGARVTVAIASLVLSDNRMLERQQHF